MALTQAVKESIWVQGLLRDLGAVGHLDEMKEINVDNQGAIALARNTEFHASTKHIDIQYHFIREHIQNHIVTLSYCPSSTITADIFTKALPHPSFIKHCIGLGLLDHSAFLLQASQEINYDPTGLYSNPGHQEVDPDVSTGEGWYCESPALTLDFSPDTTPTLERQRCYKNIGTVTCS